MLTNESMGDLPTLLYIQHFEVRTSVSNLGDLVPLVAHVCDPTDVQLLQTNYKTE